MVCLILAALHSCVCFLYTYVSACDSPMTHHHMLKENWNFVDWQYTIKPKVRAIYGSQNWPGGPLVNEDIAHWMLLSGLLITLGWVSCNCFARRKVPGNSKKWSRLHCLCASFDLVWAALRCLSQPGFRWGINRFGGQRNVNYARKVMCQVLSAFSCCK